jgi:hypothetical protein
VNPNGRIPAIDDNGFKLWESMAINLYLAKKHGSGLLPKTMEDEAQAIQWSFWVMTEVEKPALAVLLHRFFLREDQRDSKLADEGEQQLQKPLEVLDQRLATPAFIVDLMSQSRDFAPMGDDEAAKGAGVDGEVKFSLHQASKPLVSGATALAGFCCTSPWPSMTPPPHILLAFPSSDMDCERSPADLNRFPLMTWLVLKARPLRSALTATATPRLMRRGAMIPASWAMSSAISERFLMEAKRVVLNLKTTKALGHRVPPILSFGS